MSESRGTRPVLSKVEGASSRRLTGASSIGARGSGWSAGASSPSGRVWQVAAVLALGMVRVYCAHGGSTVITAFYLWASVLRGAAFPLCNKTISRPRTERHRAARGRG
eukprot:4999302-Prymnesium_polylepis.1